MEDAALNARLDAIEKKIDATFVSAEKTRKYFQTIVIVSVVAFVLPLVGLLFAIPSFLSSYSSISSMGL
jgi:tetrahydromethanopterin S-methyltransferase subunit G